MKKLQELSLKIEDLEERIAPHISVWVDTSASSTGMEHGAPQDVEGKSGISVHTEAGVHASLGPDAETFVAPHF